MKNTAFTITGSGNISVLIDGKSFTVEKSHKNYDAILNSVKDRDWDLFISLVDLTTPVKVYLAQSTSAGKVELNDGAITYEGEAIHNSLTDRILSFVSQGLPFEPLMNFLGNLMLNPSKTAVDELYGFLEVGSLPITEDGFVLAFKNVKSDFYSIHGNPAIKPIKGKVNEKGQIFNGVGEEIEIKRNQVNEDREQTCSDGLHVASIGYLPNFSDSRDGKTVVCKVNPKDFCAIPKDYENQKARVCAYTVVSIYEDDWRKKIEEGNNGFDFDVYNTSDGQIYGVKPSGSKFYNVRDKSGKFASK